MKTDFVANASHELRTPLSTIRGAVETLLHIDLEKDAVDAARFVGVIDRHSGRLAAMVSDLLDLARLESATARFEPRGIDPRDLLRELEERFADVVRARGLIWETHCEDAGRRIIRASPQLVRLVLDNLVDNATKFTDRGGRVCVSCACEPGRVTFCVEDEGCGIPEPEQERVFERFYQLERARSGPERGTGLGLSIVRHAVAAMNGRVRLESRVGEGTRMTVEVPQDPGDIVERTGVNGSDRAA
jgi:signal transduction histidine kinase